MTLLAVAIFAVPVVGLVLMVWFAKRGLRRNPELRPYDWERDG